MNVCTDKGLRGHSAQFFVAGELCRRNLVAVVTLGNCPNTDILCSDVAASRFAHIQVKTFVPGIKTCSIGRKAEHDFGALFFWVLAGIPLAGSDDAFTYYVIPSADMAREVSAQHAAWMRAPGAKGQAHNDSNVRTVMLNPTPGRWDIEPYRGRWDLIEAALRSTAHAAHRTPPPTA